MSHAGGQTSTTIDRAAIVILRLPISAWEAERQAQHPPLSHEIRIRLQPPLAGIAR